MSVVGGLQTGERAVAGLAGLGSDPSQCWPPIGRLDFFFPAGHVGGARRRARWRELARPRVGKAAKQLSFGRQAAERQLKECTVLLTVQ